MKIVYCPFCDREFSDSAKYEFGTEEELQLHIFEYHHIVEKEYYRIRNALELKQSVNRICKDIKNTILEFAERIETLRRNEVSNLFENAVEWGTGDKELWEEI